MTLLWVNSQLYACAVNLSLSRIRSYCHVFSCIACLAARVTNVQINAGIGLTRHDMATYRVHHIRCFYSSTQSVQRTYATDTFIVGDACRSDADVLCRSLTACHRDLSRQIAELHGEVLRTFGTRECLDLVAAVYTADEAGNYRLAGVGVQPVDKYCQEQQQQRTVKCQGGHDSYTLWGGLW